MILQACVGLCKCKTKRNNNAQWKWSKSDELWWFVLNLCACAHLQEFVTNVTDVCTCQDVVQLWNHIFRGQSQAMLIIVKKVCTPAALLTWMQDIHPEWLELKYCFKSSKISLIKPVGIFTSCISDSITGRYVMKRAVYVSAPCLIEKFTGTCI